MSATPMDADSTGPLPEPAYRFGVRGLLLLTLGYLAALFVATYPFVWSLGDALPGSLYDPLQHLWILKWYKTCLIEGRSPVMSPELMYPIGAPLGTFSPLLFQALLFLPLSTVFSEVVSFNIIWVFGFVTTGLGTFALIRQVVRDDRCAALGGLLAMLSGPMLVHGRAHLELIYVGSIPLFLAAWLRFVDAPSRRRLAAAAASYVIVALCAAYYAVFAIIPAGLYWAWIAVGSGKRREWGWFRSRARWLAAFSAIVVPCLVLSFGNQLWAMSEGYSIPRPVEEFEAYGTPPWTYVAPTILHATSGLLESDPYNRPGPGWKLGEKASYLGIVSLGLVAFAAISRAPLRRRGYWWATLAALVVLSCGASIEVGSTRVPLPGLWLKEHLFLFKLIRVPARFNLFVAVVAALLASAGLRELLRRRPGRGWQTLIVGVLAAVALLDLSTRPFPPAKIPPLPDAYAFIRAQDPNAGMVEVPQATAGGSFLYSVCGYWQSRHRLRTNAGYSGHGNFPFDNRLSFNSPFYRTTLANPDYAADPEETTFDIVGRVNARDYIWLYLKANGFRFVVVHSWAGATEDGDPDPSRLRPLRALLADAKVFDSQGVTVFDAERLGMPKHPVPLTTSGWRVGFRDGYCRVVEPEAHVAAFNPDPSRPVRLVLSAAAAGAPRAVRLGDAAGRELASWTVEPGEFRFYLSPPLLLSEGFQVLALRSQGEHEPGSAAEQATSWDDRPFSLWVKGLALLDASKLEAPAPAPPARLAEGGLVEPKEVAR